MRQEIENHWEKLKRLAKLSESELREARFQMFLKLNFINEGLISKKTWLAAEQTLADIDLDDSDFVALTIHLRGYLWTGDKQLYKGLKRKNFKRVYNTAELLHLRKGRS